MTFPSSVFAAILTLVVRSVAPPLYERPVLKDPLNAQVGGENGNILVWSVHRDCLIYEIPAHEGEVFDCSWSGDSRQLLSVGADGRVRLWDAAAGCEICRVS